MVLAIYENTSLNIAFKVLWIHCDCEIATAHFTPQCLQFCTERNTLLSKIKSINTSILNQNNLNFTETLFFGDPSNSPTIDTLILLPQILQLTLFWIPKDSMCLYFNIYRHGYFYGYYFLNLLVCTLYYFDDFFSLPDTRNIILVSCDCKFFKFSV